MTPVRKWEKITMLLESNDRITKARLLFDLMEGEREAGVESFKDYGLPGAIKLAIARHIKASRKDTRDSD